MEKKPITQPLTNANPSDTDTSAVFAQEQEHLSATYGKLQEMEKNLEDRIGAIEEKAAAEKLDIRENLALNFEGDSESMETYIEVEVMNHTIVGIHAATSRLNLSQLFNPDGINTPISRE